MRKEELILYALTEELRAVKFSNIWEIPGNPKDARIKSGKYIKVKAE